MFYMNLLINHSIFKANIISLKIIIHITNTLKYIIEIYCTIFFYISKNVTFDEKLYFLIIYSLIMMYL